MLGALQLNAAFSIGFDIDIDALNICQQNINEANLNEFCDIINVDLILSKNSLSKFYETFDIVITNPPFGTKNNIGFFILHIFVIIRNLGIDMKFVDKGLQLLRKGGTLYSLHKTSTRSFIEKKAKKDWQNVKVECIAELRWNLDKTYPHQKKKTIDIDVDLFKFSKL